MKPTPTPEMIDAALSKTPFIPNDGNRAWMAEALSAALSAQPAAAVVGEPVAWAFRNNGDDMWLFARDEPEICYEKQPLYAAPFNQRTEVEPAWWIVTTDMGKVIFHGPDKDRADRVAAIHGREAQPLYAAHPWPDELCSRPSPPNPLLCRRYGPNGTGKTSASTSSNRSISSCQPLEAAMSDHERIWLQNAADARATGDRLWCQDKVWPECAEQQEPTEYIRADLYASRISQQDAELDRLRRELGEARAKLFPYADATEISGISFDGKYLIGDKKSISYFHEMKNRGEQIDVYKRAFDQRIAAAESENATLKAGIKRLSDEEELISETGSDEALTAVHLAARLAEAEEFARVMEAEANQLREVSISNRHRAEAAEANARALAFVEVEQKAREWAEHYPHASDGRNTFILFAEWAEGQASLAKAEETGHE